MHALLALLSGSALVAASPPPAAPSAAGVGPAVATAAPAESPLAVNYRAVTERIHTAGQPDATTLATLGARGFGLVVNLAPPSNPGAVPDEGKLVSERGAAYVNIPVNWQKPTDADFEFFRAVMKAGADRKVLVHCQMNYRASAFTFLYRVIEERVPPAEAYAAMRQVWRPRDQWATFVQSTLERYRVAFTLPPE
jgi:protein tyrosine phosphatase (PTP) superfamily phosphohydrolase (DUF442 family)